MIRVFRAFSIVSVPNTTLGTCFLPKNIATLNTATAFHRAFSTRNGERCRLENTAQAQAQSRAEIEFDAFENAREQGGMVADWPIHKTNTFVNICQQGEKHVIERFGSYLQTNGPGLYLAIPFIDKVKRIDIREKAVIISPQMAISRDNVSVRMSGVVYLRFVDAEKAVYGHYSPLFATLQHSQSAMRAAIGELELDALFHDRASLNVKITTAISEAAANWGIEVLRYEVTEILPDKTISDAMDRQAQAERIRREKVLQASGDKESQILRSQGDLEARTNEALARKAEFELHAQGRANAVTMEAEAQAKAIDRVANALLSESGDKAARLELARDYMKMMGEIGKQSNTIFFGEQAGDISTMMARVSAALQTGSTATAFQQQEKKEKAQ